MFVKVIKTRVFREKERLLPFIQEYLDRRGGLREGAILVVTSKIVALAEGRAREITSPATREKLIKAESQWAMKTKYTWLTVKDGTVMSSAGVDESNARGKIILLPRDSFRSAAAIRRALMTRYRLKRLGVLVSDSRLLPLRAGIVGIALGYAGFRGVRDYRGTPDIFGRILKLSRTDVADGLATAAVLEMGEGAEQQPLAIITGAPVAFTDTVDRYELAIDPREDIYQPIFEKIRKIRLIKAGRRAARSTK